MRIALTGGIACGKSLTGKYLEKSGVRTIDADDIAHELVPEEERRRIADEVFRDPAKRSALEERLHPVIRARLAEAASAAEAKGEILVEIVPLLFECHWEKDYGIIASVISPRSLQIERMTVNRGHTPEQAEARLAAQLPAGEKAERSDYVIINDGTPAKLEEETKRFVEWLKGRCNG